MDNISFFNCITLALFAKLYSAFPTPIDCNPAEIAMSIIPEEGEKKEIWNALQAAEDVIDFLAQEGLLTYKDKYLDSSTFLQTRLTLKGLAILGSVPPALKGNQSLIDQIQNTLAGGAKAAGVETIKLLMQHTFTAALATRFP